MQLIERCAQRRRLLLAALQESSAHRTGSGGGSCPLIQPAAVKKRVVARSTLGLDGRGEGAREARHLNTPMLPLLPLTMIGKPEEVACGSLCDKSAARSSELRKSGASKEIYSRLV